jgi:hypothetical protein
VAEIDGINGEVLSTDLAFLINNEPLDHGSPKKFLVAFRNKKVFNLKKEASLEAGVPPQSKKNENLGFRYTFAVIRSSFVDGSFHKTVPP